MRLFVIWKIRERARWSLEMEEGVRYGSCLMSKRLRVTRTSYFQVFDNYAVFLVFVASNLIVIQFLMT